MHQELHELTFKELCELKYQTKQAQRATLQKLIAESKKEFEVVLDLIQKEINKKSSRKVPKNFKDLTHRIKNLKHMNAIERKKQRENFVKGNLKASGINV